MAEAVERPGTVPKGGPAKLSAKDLVSIYETMVVARVMDERCLTLQRQGRIGFYVPLQGQEAAQVACAWALKAEDWIFPAYRELGIALTRGIPVQKVIDQLIGNSADVSKGRQMPNHYGFREFNFVTASSPVGTQITHAVGAGLAARRRGDRIVTICFFGDGTTSSNDFHAGLNFAGVFQAPTIFFCQNNQWAISLPRERQTKSATLAIKAEAYGFPGVVVDGTDVHAVYEAVSAARSRAVAGKGPTLIEAQVYRLGPHSTSDDPRRYRTDEELKHWKERDPLARLKNELVTAHGLAEEEDQKIWEAAKAMLAKALEASEATPAVDPTSLFDDVFSSPTAGLAEERQQFTQLLEDGVIKP